MAYYKSVTELIGHTPVLELSRYEEAFGLKAKLLAKVEGLNPGGSIKDRTALAMLEEARRQGRIAPGALIIEPTSGNTGIGLASACAALGYRLVIVMPDSMSVERQNMMKAYGARLVLTPGALGMNGAIKRARQLCASEPGSFIPDQFCNPANPRIHRETTGPEIWKDLDGKVDLFVAGIGTGGTISGAGAYLKEKNPAIRVVGVEPAGSPVLSGGCAGVHGLQGIGAGFVPEALDVNVYDEIIAVSDEDALATGRHIARLEGLLAGISSGAAVFAAALLARRPENAGKNIVVILPDNGDRYLSTPMFADASDTGKALEP